MGIDCWRSCWRKICLGRMASASFIGALLTCESSENGSGTTGLFARTSLSGKRPGRSSRLLLRRKGDLKLVLSELGGQLFAERRAVDNYFQCNKPAKPFVPRWGISFACVLPQNHEGPCAHGGTCYKHGPYVGDKCPEWPNCTPPTSPTVEQFDNEVIFARIEEHIRTAPEREAAALERAKQSWVRLKRL